MAREKSSNSRGQGEMQSGSTSGRSQGQSSGENAQFGQSKLDNVYQLTDSLIDQFLSNDSRNRAIKYGVRAIGEAIIAYQEGQSHQGGHSHDDSDSGGEGRSHSKKKHKR